METIGLIIVVAILFWGVLKGLNQVLNNGLGWGINKVNDLIEYDEVSSAYNSQIKYGKLKTKIEEGDKELASAKQIRELLKMKLVHDDED